MINIPEIQFYSFFYAGVSAVAIHLGPASHAGFHLVLDHVERYGFLELFHKVGEFGAWADQAHVAFQDVDELGEFVQAGFSQERADLCSSGVGVCCPGSIFFCVLPHAAEFQHLEFFFLVADSCLFEKDRTGAGSFDTDGDDQKKRAEDDEADDADDEIKGSLQDCPAEILQAVDPHIDQFAVADGFNDRIGRNNIIVKWNNRIDYAIPLAGRDNLPEPCMLFRVKGNHYFIDIR